jgi:thiol:disulfide interchange protein DsbD
MMKDGMSSSAVDQGFTRSHFMSPAARVWLAALIAAFAGTLPVSAQPVKTEHVTAELVAERGAVQPGEPLRIGLLLQHIPHWHTYWRNPGDSGLPTTLSWTLPAGSQAGEIDWPAPKRLPIGPLVNYGYEGELLLPLSYTPPADARPGSTLSLQAKATWLVCRDVCIPESATLTLQLPVVGGGASADGVTPGSTEYTELFERARGEQSAPLAGWAVDAQQAGRELLVTFSKPLDLPASRPALQLFPYAEQLIEPARHEVFRTDSGYAVKLRLLDGVAPPPSLSGIAVAQGVTALGAPTVWGNARRSAEFDTPVRAVAAFEWPAGSKALVDPQAGGPTPETLGSGADLGWATALLLAFVGGMVLNLMPCVFPVLSIKLLSLAKHGGDEPPTTTALRTHAAAYSAGVVLSFLALAALLLALRAAGSAIGWGFQLQEPGVVFVLALLFFALGLNLMGAFEFGGLLPQGLAAWRDRRPAVDALASGVLAVVAASPCTAPFMGAALGYAITQSPVVGLSVFGALGLGMALPYALLVLMPGWRSRLPRPGAWMLRLKQALAFPMFLTVVWLVWVLGQQTGIDGAAKALIALVVMAFAIWVASGRSRASQAGNGQALARRAIGGLMLVAALAWSWPGEALSGNAAAARTAVPGSPDAAWAPYDETVIAERLAAGQPVFVDFTAAWCVSCQVNKRLVLHTDATMQAFAQAEVSLMRADWTQRDARITEALARLGRNGVPVYVLLRPGREPLLLPEILTAKLVRDALATL